MFRGTFGGGLVPYVWEKTKHHGLGLTMADSILMVDFLVAFCIAQKCPNAGTKMQKNTSLVGRKDPTV